MAVVTEPKSAVGSMVPVFQLMSEDGRAVSIWDYKGRSNMVIALLTGGDCPLCTEFLTTVMHAYHRYEQEKAVVLPIVRGTQEEATALRRDLQSPFPVLFDSEGHVTERFSDRLPAVFVADRYGEIYAEWIVGPGGSFPTQKEILDVVELINLECPE